MECPELARICSDGAGLNFISPSLTRLNLDNFLDLRVQDWDFRVMVVLTADAIAVSNEILS
jgi:hypothetical protein